VSRRRKLPPLREGYTRTYLVAVVCTSRGTHAEAGIANLGEFVDVAGAVSVLWQHAGHPDPLTGWQAPDGSRTFRFRCPRCPSERGRPRDVQLREPHVLAYIDALRTADRIRPVLDISSPALC
jgi:hypothetical protein